MICRAWVPVLIDEKNGLPSWIRASVDGPFGRGSDGYKVRKNTNSLGGLPGESPYQAEGTYKSPGFPILSVREFQLDVIRKVEGTARSVVIPADWLRYGNLVGIQHNLLEPVPSTRRVINSFWRTMVADRGQTGRALRLDTFVCEKAFTTVVEYGGDVNLSQIHDGSRNTLQKVLHRARPVGSVGSQTHENAYT
jgi:hypothetical protein